MRKPFVAGNWKMNTDRSSAIELAKAVCTGAVNAVGANKITVALCPPFVYLAGVADAVGNTGIGVGAQDVYFEAKGAFTGEISTSMLKDVGCAYAICGHSERRHVLGETDELINKKLIATIEAGMLPILCVGELLEERDAGNTESVVETQLKGGLAGVSVEQMQQVTIAYEPVWAIGTGRTATPDQAQEVHAFIRKVLADMFNGDVAEQTRIQYGGSVKPGNAAELIGQPDVDGALVGGASLKAEDFLGIIQAAL